MNAHRCPSPREASRDAREGEQGRGPATGGGVR